MKAIERLYQYFEYKSIKPTRFEKNHGLSNGYFSVQLKRGADIGTSILEIVINNCRDLNVVWLITGKEDMICIDNASPSVQGPSLNYTGLPVCKNCKTKDELNDSLRQQIKVLNKLIRKYEDQESPKADGQKRKAAS